MASTWWVVSHVGLPDPGVSPVLFCVLFLASVITSRLDMSAGRSLRTRHHDERISLHEGSLVLLLVVLPAGWAWLLVLFGFGTEFPGRGRGMKYLFNLGTWASTLAAAVAVHEAIAPGTATVLSGRRVVALAAAVLVHLVANHMAVQVVLAAATGTPLRVQIVSTWQLVARTWVGNLLGGLAAAALWLQAPWLALVALGLAIVLRGAYEQAVEARRVLDAVRLDRDRLDLVTETSTLGVVLLDHDGTVTVWNSAVSELTGIPNAEAVERHVDAVLADRVKLVEQSSGRPASLAAATASGDTPAPTELTVTREDGEQRVAHVTHTLQHDELGGVARVVVQLRDLTAQREVDRLKEDFLARVTHELRTPLTSILGFGRTLLDRADQLPDGMRQDLTGRLVHAGETLEQLVDDLLLVSSPAAALQGRTTLALQPQALGPLVDAAVTGELKDHPDREVQVSHVAPVMAEVDQAWLMAVVRHLVCNGVQYSDGAAAVVVEVDADPTHAIVRVVDRGRGIPRSKLRTVFERFTRVEDPLRMETRGAGLGLFIVDRLVTRMGGHVEVDSTLGEGSTFTVYLARGGAEGAASAPAEEICDTSVHASP